MKDKEIYKKSPEFTDQYNAYKNALDETFYEIVSCYGTDFTTKGANIFKSIPDHSRTGTVYALPLLPIMSKSERNNEAYTYCAMPVKPTSLTKPKSKYDFYTIKLPLYSTDIRLLQQIENAVKNEEIGLLCIMKPGVFVQYYDYDNIATSVGLYLINTRTKDIYADFSKFLDKTLPLSYKKSLPQKEIRERAVRERLEKEEFRKTYGNNASSCGHCGGLGKLTYWSNGHSYQKLCNYCGGRGVIYKR